MNHKLYKQISEYQPYDEREKIDKEVMLNFIKSNEDVLTRDNKVAHFTTSAWITNKERTKVLMIYHNIYDSWAWVGGHADGDDEEGYRECSQASHAQFGRVLLVADGQNAEDEHEGGDYLAQQVAPRIADGRDGAEGGKHNLRLV